MAHAYTPGLRVAPNTVIRKTRRLPLAGDVVVADGDHVSPETVVAETHLPGNVHNVNVANILGVSPGDITSCMLKQLEDQVSEGDILAQSKGIWGLFKAVAKSPISGTIDLISDVTGQVLVREPPIPVQVNAYIDGRVVETIPHEGVVVETTGAFIQGIFGIGGEIHAPIMMIVDAPETVITDRDIDDRCVGKIVCGGSLVTLDALRKLKAAGAAGVVTGGVHYHDVGELLGYQIGVAITGGEDIGLTIIATEGFGRMRMANRTFHLLRTLEGCHASISGATQIRAGVIRPEVIIPGESQARPEPGAGHHIQGLVTGSLVRIIRDPYFGQLGTVDSLPEQLKTLPSEASVRVLDVQLETGDCVTVPRANVELVEE